MRLNLPPRPLRHDIVEQLHDAYAEPRLTDIRAALALLAKHYDLPAPRVTWLKDRQRRDRYGDTRPCGTVALMRPVQWRRQRKPGALVDERSWVTTALHEAYHYLWWVQDERKADAFAAAMVEGL